MFLFLIVFFFFFFFFFFFLVNTLTSSFHTSCSLADNSIFDDAFKDLEDLDKKEEKKTKKTTASDEGEDISTSTEQRKITKATAKNPSVRSSFKKMNRVG